MEVNLNSSSDAVFFYQKMSETTDQNFCFHFLVLFPSQHFKQLKAWHVFVFCFLFFNLLILQAIKNMGTFAVLVFLVAQVCPVRVVV